MSLFHLKMYVIRQRHARCSYIEFLEVCYNFVVSQYQSKIARKRRDTNKSNHKQENNNPNYYYMSSLI